MTKRIIGMFLAVCVMMSTLPTAAFAADEVSAKINGISVPAAGGSIVGEGISGSITFDVESKTLTLENAEISVTTETRAIDIRSGIDTLILKGKNEIKWADESDKTVSIYAISASVSSFLIKGNSRNDSLTVTLPGTKDGYRSAYAISTANCEIRNCSADITVIGGMQNFGDNVAIRVSDLKIKNAALDLIVGKDRQGNVQKAMQGGCVYATGRISIENSYIHAGIYSALGQGAAFYAALQGQGGTTCTDSVIYAESDVLQAGRTICLDGVDTTFSVKNSVLKAKSNQYAFSGYNYAKPTFESSLVELESKDIVMRGPTFGTVSGFTKITATDKNGNVSTYNPGDDLSTLSADSRKVVIESPVHSHCVCGNDTDSGDHTSHSEEIWMPWSSTNTLPNDTGNYYLVNDVSVKSPWFAGWNNGEIKLCLNGKSLIFEKEYLLAHSFTLTDCIGGGGIYGENCNGIAVVSVRGNFNMYGGSIINKGESRFENVGIVTEWDWTSFNLYGGTVGNSSEGCAIWLSGNYGNTPLFNAYGGRVEGILYNPNFGKPVNFFDTEFMSLVRLPKFAKTVGTPNFGENGKYDYIYPIMLENDGVYTEVTDSNKDDVFGDGTVKYELAEEGETEKSVLTLDNAHIKASAGFGTIMPYGIDSEFESYNRDIDIVLIGENTVEETGGGYCISAFPGRTLTFRGDGKLNAVGKGVDLIGGIVDATHIVVESGDISVSSEKYGISSLDFTVNGGKIKIDGDKAAVWPSVYYTEDYGKITVNGGILELFAGENDGKLIDSGSENPSIDLSDGMSMITSSTLDAASAVPTKADNFDAISNAKYLCVFGAHNHCLCGGNEFDGHTTHTETVWQAWTSSDSLPTTAGNYYLANDVTLPAGVTELQDGVSICLNGRKIVGMENNDSKIKANGALTVTDCMASGSVGNFGFRNGRLDMYGGKIAENTRLIIDPGTAFLLSGNSVNEGSISIYGYVDFTMKGNAVNTGKICLKETYNDKSIVFGGRAKGGTVEVEHPNDDAGICIEENAQIAELIGVFHPKIKLSTSDNAEICRTEEIVFSSPKLLGNSKLGSADGNVTILTSDTSKSVEIKDNVQLFGSVTVEMRNDCELLLGDNASVTGELTVMNTGMPGDSSKVVLTGESAVHGKLSCADDKIVFEMGDNAVIDGDIDLKSCNVNGKVTCGGNIIDGIFNDEVVNNGKIMGGIFYGAVSGNGKIEDSAKRTVSFDSKGGSAVESQKILRGQRAVVPADCKKDGYTLGCWSCGGAEYDFSAPVLEDIGLEANWTAKAYTVRFDTKGGSDLEDKNLLWSDKILDGANPPAREDGYEFVGWKYGDVDITADMTYADLAADDSVMSITLTAMWRDVENPTGEIIIKDNRWNKFLKGITFGLFFKETQNVTVIASDNSGGQVKIEYLLSQKELTEEELANAAFKDYAEFGIDPDNEYIIYVRLTDDAGNVSYICSEGIVLDGTVPIIGEIENGRTYCEAQTVTVEDKYIGSVAVNGKEIALDENGRFVLEPSQGEQKITVTDKAGNVSEVTVTVNFGHTPLDDDGDCTTPVMCEFCGKEAIAAKSHDFKGDYVVTKSGHGKKCTNGGCSVSEEEKPHFAEPDGDCTTDDICECGYFVTEAKASHDFGKWVSKGDGAHTRRCLSEGCTAGVETEGCFGGRANCVEKAVCEGCAASYGQIDEKNHENAEHIPAANPTTQSEGNIEYWRCKDCGKYFSDASLTKEIFLSDTVLKRLEPEQAPPKTGESKAIFPALCLLCTAAFVIIKKSNKQK